jgi:hypothetical protein
MGVSVDRASPSIRSVSGAASFPLLSEGAACTCGLVDAASFETGASAGGEPESEDRMMGASGPPPHAGRGVMREGECGAGATMPSDDVSIGEEPPEVESRDSWKAGPAVTMAGIPLAGRRFWRAFQNSSETTVRAGEPPCEAAAASSMFTMVSLTTASGMCAMAASTAAFCSWESETGKPAQRLSASNSQRISGWEDDSQHAMGWEGIVTPNAASLWAKSELRTVWNPGLGGGWGLSAGLVFRRGGMMNDEVKTESEQ